ncbi:MAG: ATP-binding protein [Chloroflexi bacterium]|nr:ATP-binding protein [Chloroflexota bacterium]
MDLTRINDHDLEEQGIPVIGRVASPSGKEATADQFYFWVDREQMVENTQIIRTASQIGGTTYTFYAVVEQVYRISRQRDMGEAVDVNDGDANSEPPFNSDGITYALARILRTEPEVFTPPMDRSRVYLCNETETEKSYGADENPNPLSVGQIKNGGAATAGAGKIDLDYLLGAYGGHMNVNGVAGGGTKSSFLLFTICMLLHKAEQQLMAAPSDPNRLRVVPIILNVKGFDLFTIDQTSRRYIPGDHLAAWNALGVVNPQPFHDVKYFAPQAPGGTIAISTPAVGTVNPYSWSLKDIIRQNLLLYLFSEEDADDTNFSALVLDIDAWLTDEQVHDDGTTTRSLKPANWAPAPANNHNVGDGEENSNLSTDGYDYHRIPQTFEDLLNWVKWMARNKIPGEWKSHSVGTWRKLSRRLGKLLAEGKGILRHTNLDGNPLNVASPDTTNPIVVDLNGLAGSPSLQRFVVATILRQVIEERTGTNAIRGLVYLIALDELNRFAPKGSKDSITQLIELVAAEMRSQGIILLGAQQQASKISDRVFENAAIKVVGRSGSLEMGQTIWRFMSEASRKRAANLQKDEKLIIQDTFREPMLVSVPMPPWAMRPAEVLTATSNSIALDSNGDPEIVL